MESVGTRRFPRTCTSSINTCCPCDRAGVALRKVQKRSRNVTFSDEAPVVKAAIPVILAAQGKKTFRESDWRICLAGLYSLLVRRGIYLTQICCPTRLLEHETQFISLGVGECFSSGRLSKRWRADGITKIIRPVPVRDLGHIDEILASVDQMLGQF